MSRKIKKPENVFCKLIFCLTCYTILHVVPTGTRDQNKYEAVMNALQFASWNQITVARLTAANMTIAHLHWKAVLEIWLRSMPTTMTLPFLSGEFTDAIYVSLAADYLWKQIKARYILSIFSQQCYTSS